MFEMSKISRIVMTSPNDLSFMRDLRIFLRQRDAFCFQSDPTHENSFPLNDGAKIVERRREFTMEAGDETRGQQNRSTSSLDLKTRESTRVKKTTPPTVSSSMSESSAPLDPTVERSFSAPQDPKKISESMKEANTLDEFLSLYSIWRGISRPKAQSTLFLGPSTARCVLILDASMAEDRLLSEKAENLLRAMIQAIHLSFDDVRIVPFLPWSACDFALSSLDEQKACFLALRKHLSFLSPRLLVCLGNSIGKHMLHHCYQTQNNERPPLRTQGQKTFYECDKDRIPVLCSLHPLSLLQQPYLKKLAWNDWLELKKILDE